MKRGVKRGKNSKKQRAPVFAKKLTFFTFWQHGVPKLYKNAVNRGVRSRQNFWWKVLTRKTKLCTLFLTKFLRHVLAQKRNSKWRATRFRRPNRQKVFAFFVRRFQCLLPKETKWCVNQSYFVLKVKSVCVFLSFVAIGFQLKQHEVICTVLRWVSFAPQR